MYSDLVGIAPEGIVTLGGLILLLLPGLRSGRLLGFVTLSFLLAAFDLKLMQLSQGPFSQPIFYNLLLQDSLGGFFQLLTLAAVILVTLCVMGSSKEEVRSRRELYALLLLTTTGLMLLAGAQNMVLIYIGLELVSLLSYLLTGFLKKESLSIEGALKYFLFGSLATGAMLYGISLLYGLTGTMDLAYFSMTFPDAFLRAPLVSVLSLLLLVIGFGFKAALVPFHMWAPDAYEGAPTPVAAFLSVGPKIAGFAVLIRVFLYGFSPEVHLWPLLLGSLSVLTMTVGNVVALVQTNAKRLLAYSSIAQAGYMVIGLGIATPLGLTATLYYLVAYLLMNIGAFLGVIAVENATGRQDLGAFSGLSQSHPALAAMIALAFLSLAGIPPMAGFFAKLWIFGAALKAQSYGLAIVAAINSVIALFYYIKVIKFMYLDPLPAGSLPWVPSRIVKLGLALCTLGLFLVGLYPGPWLLLAGNALPVPPQEGELPWL